MSLYIGLAVTPSVFSIGLETLLTGAGFSVRSFSGLQEVEADTLPDALLLEPPERGWEATLQGLGEKGMPPRRVLAVCPVDDAADAADLLALGVAGCIAPDDAPEEAVGRVRAAAEGDVLHARRHLFRLLEQAHQPMRVTVPLSGREREVLHLLACGMVNDRIAARLFLAPGSVRNLVSAIYRKAGVKSRGEAIRWAWRHGLGMDEKEG